MAERTSKLCSLSDAVKIIENGSRIGMGGFAVYQKPMAIVHEMIRANKNNLTIVGALNSIEVDMLAGAGCLKSVETSYVGLEKFGLAQNYRRAVEQGRIKAIHYPELLSWDRFRANQEGLAFWPVSFLGGSDIVNKNPDIVPFFCPITKKQLWAVPAANIDVAILHAAIGDKYGNVQIQSRHLLPQSMNTTISRSCRKLIVTVEKIIDTQEIMDNPHLTVIPAFRTTCIVHVPNGSHPTPVLGINHTDNAFFNKYIEYSASDESFKGFLDKYIYGAKNFEEYFEMVQKDFWNGKNSKEDA